MRLARKIVGGVSSNDNYAQATHARTHTHTHTHTHACTHAHTHAHACTHARARIHTHTHTHTHTHLRVVLAQVSHLRNDNHATLAESHPSNSNPCSHSASDKYTGIIQEV